MVVLAGYRTVRQALVQHADVFGHRHHMLIMQEFVKGHGKHKESSTRSCLCLSKR